MADFFNRLFDTSDFPPRWECGEWSTLHGWLHILSDVAIWAAYAAIPLALGFYWWRKRHELAFGAVVLLFGAFILSCGTVHLLEAIIFYNPVYRLQGLVKFVTAAVSWATVVAIIRIAPNALDLPGLKAVNASLTVELEKRRRAEQTVAQAHEDLQSFTSLVTHDLRNSFGGTLFMAELARDNYRQGIHDEAAAQLTSVIDAAANSDGGTTFTLTFPAPDETS